MLTPISTFGLCILIVLMVVILALAFTPHRRRDDEDKADSEVDLRSTDPYGKFRDGGIVAHHPRDLDRVPKDWGIVKKPTVVLTPRMLERVNIQRRLRSKPPLNRAGFTNAVAHAWDQPRTQPDNSAAWLTYLIIYECFIAGHQAHMVSGIGVGGLTIDPNLPYNGAGGEFAGAGSSGNWTQSTGDVGAAIAAGIGADPLSDPDSYKGSTDERPVEPATAGNGYHYVDPVPAPLLPPATTARLMSALATVTAVTEAEAEAEAEAAAGATEKFNLKGKF